MIGSLLILFEEILRKKPKTAVNNLIHSQRGFVKPTQEIKFKKTIEHVYKNSKFYKKKFDEAGINPAKIKKLGDLKKLPFTTSKDILKNPYDFLCVPSEKIVHVFTSTGTTGKPKKIFLTKKDFEILTSSMSIGFILAGVSEKSVAQIMFSYGRPSWAVGPTIQRALEKIRVLAIPSTDVLEPLEQIKIIKEYKPDTIAGTPSYIWRVSEEAGKKYELAKLGVDSIFLGAEPWPELFRKKLQKAWNVKIYDCYGMAEMGFGFAMECNKQKGLHFNEMDFLVEIINPETGEEVEDKEEGELVFTTLSREAMPLIRYRTGDITFLIKEKCKCGNPLYRIGRIRGRTDDLIIIGSGENIYQSIFNKALFKIDGLIDYQAIIEKQGYKDKIIIKAEVHKKSSNLIKKISKAVYEIPSIKNDIEKTQTMARPKVIVLKSGTLPKAGIKVRRVIDRRKSYPK